MTVLCKVYIMKIQYKKLIFIAFFALAASLLSLSCELKDPDDYEILILIMGSGSTTADDDYNKFSSTVLVDDNPPLTFASPVPAVPDGSTMLILPAGKAETITITATRANSDSTLTILIYKDNELDENGVGLLSTCNVTSTTSCSNTLNLVYKVDQEDTDDTKSASASSSSSSD